ncbi:MAG: ATP-binding protein [candidate division NC10 bacterium]|nr:ATP-binding protein [candidate division NC10 bacterium]
MDPWYKVATPRAEVREGRSFNPDEFAIALEQVVWGTAPEDYSDPVKFFSRTYFTRALSEHAGMVLRRLAGLTERTAPVLTLITQFGGGKTHTLTALYHLVNVGKKVADEVGVARMLKNAGLSEIPPARVAVFVGNAWDPREGRETPWIDVARQLAGDAGVAILGPKAKTAAPGTETLCRLFTAAGDRVLILCDEVLNFINRHRDLADGFYAFAQNLTVAMTGTSHGAAMISLPRSQVEMSSHDLEWQEKITKVVKRVAKDLIATDEAEISEVIRRRLFEGLGSEKARKAVGKAYADWCFGRRAQLPPQWTAVDSAATDLPAASRNAAQAGTTAREFLQGRFEACYPFHPSTVSVFQRKWTSLQQYQQTRGTLAMLAQWISWAYRDGYKRARREPLITLGSAPLEAADFRATILGQLGETRLESAITSDIAGDLARTKALDADAKGALKEIHRGVGATILFESSGGMVDKYAHLPELRFAPGEPEIDTTSVDSAAIALEKAGFYIRKAGTDGYRFGFHPKLAKVVNDRRASLDEIEIKKTTQAAVRKVFETKAATPLVFFPEDAEAIADSPRLTIVVANPEAAWSGAESARGWIADWTVQRGKSKRLYPAALVWFIRKPDRDLQEAVETWLAWRRDEREIATGVLGGEFEKGEKAEVAGKVRDADENVTDEVWASYRFVVLAEQKTASGLKMIDLGAGHASAVESLSGRILAALKSQGLLNESVGAGYIERNWPPALKEAGAWPLSGLRQSFLNGALTRLVDPDLVLRGKIPEFVMKGEMGLASGQLPDGSFTRVWWGELVPHDEVTFEGDVFLLTKVRARALKAPLGAEGVSAGPVAPETTILTGADESEAAPKGGEGVRPPVVPAKRTVRVSGSIPPEVWNRLGTRLIPKLKSGGDLRLNLNATSTVDGTAAEPLRKDLEQIVSDLGLADRLEVDID